MEVGQTVYLVSAAAAVLAAVTVAALVWIATPRRFPQLSLIPFVLCGSFQGATLAIAQVTDDRWLAFHMLSWSEVSVAFIYAFYVIFAAANLRNTPLLWPFRGPVGRTLILMAATVMGLWIWFWPGAHFAPGPAGGPLYVKTSLHEMSLIAWNMLLILALLASIDSFRRAPKGTEARHRAKAYAIAFGLQDIIVTVALLLLPSNDATLSGLGGILLNAGPALGWFLLARYMVRAHLFDADLRLQRGLKRGIVAAVFIGAFFMVTEAAQNYLADRHGYLAGGMAAALLVFALQPIQRLAERLVQGAMPHAGDAESLALRKLEVYRAALESTLADGSVTDKERRTLATLADQLGISAVQALDLEKETMASIVEDR